MSDTKKGVGYRLKYRNAISTPATIVRSLNKFGGKKAFGANFLLVSQNGNAIIATPPTTSMAIILGFRHSPDALGAKVRGRRISEMPAVSSKRPKKSKSYQRFFVTSQAEWP